MSSNPWPPFFTLAFVTLALFFGANARSVRDDSLCKPRADVFPVQADLSCPDVEFDVIQRSSEDNQIHFEVLDIDPICKSDQHFSIHLAGQCELLSIHRLVSYEGHRSWTLDTNTGQLSYPAEAEGFVFNVSNRDISVQVIGKNGLVTNTMITNKTLCRFQPFITGQVMNFRVIVDKPGCRVVLKMSDSVQLFNKESDTFNPEYYYISLLGIGGLSVLAFLYFWCLSCCYFNCYASPKAIKRLTIKQMHRKAKKDRKKREKIASHVSESKSERSNRSKSRSSVSTNSVASNKIKKTAPSAHPVNNNNNSGKSKKSVQSSKIPSARQKN